MIIEITEIDKLRFEKVHFYSVKLEGKATSEFKDFYNRMNLKEKDRLEFYGLVRFLKEIGTIYAAIKSKFKNEGWASRFRQPIDYIDLEDDDRDKDDFGLRLYCYRVTDNVVIIFNGDRKTVGGDVRDCPNCWPYFERANQISEGLEQAFYTGEIYISDTFQINLKPGFTLKI